MRMNVRRIGRSHREPIRNSIRVECIMEPGGEKKIGHAGVENGAERHAHQLLNNKEGIAGKLR
jgi:hypothetical protein